MARFPWQSDPFCAHLAVTCHLPTSCTLAAIRVEIMAEEREKETWLGCAAAILDRHRALVKQLV